MKRAIVLVAGVLIAALPAAAGLFGDALLIENVQVRPPAYVKSIAPVLPVANPEAVELKTDPQQLEGHAEDPKIDGSPNNVVGKADGATTSASRGKVTASSTVSPKRGGASAKTPNANQGKANTREANKGAVNRGEGIAAAEHENAARAHGDGSPDPTDDPPDATNDNRGPSTAPAAPTGSDQGQPVTEKTTSPLPAQRGATGGTGEGDHGGGNGPGGKDQGSRDQGSKDSVKDADSSGGARSSDGGSEGDDAP